MKRTVRVWDDQSALEKAVMIYSGGTEVKMAFAMSLDLIRKAVSSADGKGCRTASLKEERVPLRW